MAASLPSLLQVTQSSLPAASLHSSGSGQSQPSLNFQPDELISIFRPMRPTTDEVTSTLEAVFFELVDDITLGLLFEVHRAVKKGYFLLSDTDDEALKQFEIIDRPGFDIFGQLPPSRGRGANGGNASSASGNINHQYECPCPNCGRTLAVSRFAPHLEKCMIGLGRTSGRIASRRLADMGAILFADRSTSSASSDTGSSASRSSLGEDDFEWTLASERSTNATSSKSVKRSRGVTQRKQQNVQSTAPLVLQLGAICDQKSVNSDSSGSQSMAAPQPVDINLVPSSVPVFLTGSTAPPRRQTSGGGKRTRKSKNTDQTEKLMLNDPSQACKFQPPPVASSFLGNRPIGNVFDSLAAEIFTGSNSSSGSSSTRGKQA